MAVCAAYGIPHSALMSWDRDDRDKALWWEIHRREACPECGTRPDEWNPEQGGDLHAYESELHHCRGCEVSAQGQDKLERRKKAGEVRRGTTARLAKPREVGA